MIPGIPLGRSPKGNEVVQLRRVVRDRYGDITTTEALVTFKRCGVLPRVMDGLTEQGQLAIPGFTVYIPPMKHEWGATVPAEDQEVRHTDQLFVRGRWLEIDGEVANYVDLKGKLKGTMAATKGESV